MGNVEILNESRVQNFIFIDKIAYSGTISQEDLHSSELCARPIVPYHTNTNLRKDCNASEYVLTTF